MKKACQVRVYGRVQGVGFRYFTRAKALENNIKGFVRNLADGSVYIEAEGEEAALDLFQLWIKKGPSWSHVSKMETHPASFRGFENFEIF